MKNASGPVGAEALLSCPGHARPAAARKRLKSDSVAIVLGLVGALRRQAEIICLLVGELGQFHADLVEMQRRDLFVEVLGSV